MSSCRAFPVHSPSGEPPGIIDSPPPPVPITRRRARRIRGEAQQRCSVPHPSASPPFLMLKRKPDASPSAPLKRFRRNESAAPLFVRDPYDAAIDRERAASVAAALEHAFWAPNAEGDKLKIEDYLIAMTGDKLAKLSPL